MSQSTRNRVVTSRRKAVLSGIAGAAVAVVAPSAGAQTNGAWQHAFATYLMGTGLDGEVGIGPLSADVDVSFQDLVDHLRLGVMMAYAAERDPWTIGVDAIYMNLEASKADGALAAEADANDAIVSIDAAYRLSERLEVLGGIRYNEIEADLAVSGLPGGAVMASGRESWVDPYVGGRYTLPFAQDWSFTLRADVGGFGVGAESAWQLVTRFNWHASDRVDVLFGYRVLDVDYDDGEGEQRFLFDIQTSGPLVGVGWRY